MQSYTCSEQFNSLNSAIHVTNVQLNPNVASPSFRAHESLNGSAALYSISIYHHLDILTYLLTYVLTYLLTYSMEQGPS